MTIPAKTWDQINKSQLHNANSVVVTNDPTEMLAQCSYDI